MLQQPLLITHPVSTPNRNRNMVSFLLGLQTLLLELPAAILCALLHVARYNLSKVKRTVKSQTCTNPKRIGCPCKDSLYQFAILLSGSVAHRNPEHQEPEIQTCAICACRRRLGGISCPTRLRYSSMRLRELHFSALGDYGSGPIVLSTKSRAR